VFRGDSRVTECYSQPLIGTVGSEVDLHNGTFRDEYRVFRGGYSVFRGGYRVFRGYRVIYVIATLLLALLD